MNRRALRRGLRSALPRLASGTVLVAVLVGLVFVRRVVSAREAPDRELTVTLPELYLRTLREALATEVGPLLDAAVPTAAYAVPALAVAVPLGTAIGVAGALWHRRLLGTVATAVGYVGSAVPEFVLAVVAVEYLLRYGGWLQVYWENEPPFSPANVESYAVLAAVLAVQVLAVQVGYTRSAVANELSAGYVATIRAKGGGLRSVLWHVAPNALPTVAASMVTRLTPFLLLEIVVLEHPTVFGVDGLGRLVLGAMLSGSGQAAVVLVLAAAPIFLGTAVEDAVRRVVDPRA